MACAGTNDLKDCGLRLETSKPQHLVLRSSEEFCPWFTEGDWAAARLPFWCAMHKRQGHYVYAAFIWSFSFGFFPLFQL